MEPQATHPSPNSSPNARLSGCVVRAFEPPARGACEPKLAWALLSSGELIVEEFHGDGAGTTVILRRRSARDPERPTERQRTVLEQALRGKCTKVIAMELGRSYAVTTTELHQALSAMGLRPSYRLPIFLAQLEAASRLGTRLGITLREAPGAGRFVMQVALELGERLSPGEREVCLLMLLGQSNGQIARTRGATYRTVMNQLASVYRKFDVKSRKMLLRALSERRRERPFPAY